MSRGSENKVTLVAQYFYPDLAATGQLLEELTTSLTKEGLEIEVYTGMPSYHTEKDAPRFEVHDGVQVHRLPNTRLDKDSFLGAILNRFTFLVLAFFALIFKRNIGKLFVTSDPPFLPLVGGSLNLLRGKKYICLVFDVQPDAAIVSGRFSRKSMFVKLWEAINNWMFSKANKIIVLGKYMKDEIQGKLSNNGELPSIEIIPNWADGEFIRPIPKEENWFLEEHNLVETTNVLYSGNINLNKDLGVMVESATEIDKEKLSNEVRFVFIGEGENKVKLQKMVEGRNLDNVLFLDYQPKDVLPYSLNAGDLAVIYQKKELQGLVVPSKLYSSMAAGSAILGLVPQKSEVAEVIYKSGCGVRVPPDRPRVLAEVIQAVIERPELLESMQKKSREYFENNFDKPYAVNRYKEVLTSS